MNNTSNRTLFGVLSYIGPLVIISLLAGPKDEFSKFHVKQGLVVFGIEIVFWVLSAFLFWQLWVLWRIINLITLILSIIGIVNVLQNKQKELPVVGSWAHKFKV